MARGTCGPSGRYQAGEQRVFDRWTLGHAAAGVVYAWMGLKWPTALVAAVGWELLENPLKRNLPTVFPDSCQDSAPNAVGDILAVVAAYGVTRMLLYKEEPWSPPKRVKKGAR